MKNIIPYLDLPAQYRQIQAEAEPLVLDILRSGRYVMGRQVADFEARFASFCSAKAAIAVNTGTSALHIAFLAAGIGRGDEIIAPAMTFIATLSGIDYTGARPVLVDVDPVTFTMDPAKIEAAITPRTKAICPVHLYGQCADMDPILEIARRRGLLVIEDAAQAHGAEYKGRRAGSMGVMGCFSFYPGKNLGACGEGGAVVTSDPALERTMRLLRDWGAPQKYRHDLKGFNYRLDEIQGALLRIKLQHLEDWTEGRIRVAHNYQRALADIPGVQLPIALPHNRHVYHIYPIRVADRDGLKKRLDDAGVGTGIHYPIPCHLQPCFAELGYKEGDFPVAEAIAREELSLPIYPELGAEQIRAIAALVRSSL